MTTLKLNVISDIHANYDALRAALREFRHCDSLVCLGDLVGYGAQPNEVVEEIRQLNPQVIIAGNHDYATVTGDTSNFVAYAARAVQWTRKKLKLENLAFLTKLAYHSSNIMNSVVVASYHGSPRDPLNEYVYPDAPQFMLRTLIKEAHANLLLLGHTHVPFDLPTPSGSLVNPGSIGQPRDADPRASYAKLEISDDKINCTIKRISYDVQSAANRIIEEKLPTLLADRLFAGI